MKSSIFLITILAATFASKVAATPNGAGSCAAGISAIETDSAENRHIQYAGFPGSTDTRDGNSGTLFEGATVVTLNGEVLVPNANNNVPSGEELVWEITAEQVAFKGLLVRLEKASADFTNIGADDTLQNSALCDAFTGVIGVTHVNNEPKPISSGTISFTSGGTATLDITVVYDNVDTSLYAFSRFPLVIDAAEIPTAAPVADAPTATPTAVPSPVVAPTPVAVPTEELPTPSPMIQTEPPILAPALTPEPTKAKGMMKDGMEKGMMKGGMDKEGGMKGGMGKEGGMKGGMDKEGGMKKEGKEKEPKEGKETKVPKEKGTKEPKVKDGKMMDGMKMKKGSDDDEYDDDYDDDDYDDDYYDDDYYDDEDDDVSETVAPATSEPSQSPAPVTVMKL